MSEVQVTFVPAEYAAEIWPKVRGYVVAATERTGGRYDAEDVLYEILEGQQILWVAIEGQHVVGAVTTRMVDYPRMRVLAVPIIGGSRFKEWGPPMLELLRTYAANNNCATLEGYGRSGWSRVFKANGYKHLWSCAEVPVSAASTGE